MTLNQTKYLTANSHWFETGHSLTLGPILYGLAFSETRGPTCWFTSTQHCIMQPAPSQGFQPSTNSFTRLVLGPSASFHTINQQGVLTCQERGRTQCQHHSTLQPQPHLPTFSFTFPTVFIHASWIQNFNSFHHARLRHKWHWKCTKCYTLFTQQTLPNLFQPFHLYFSSKQFSQPSFIFSLSNFTPTSPHCGVHQVQKWRCPLMQTQKWRCPLMQTQDYQRFSLPSPK